MKITLNGEPRELETGATVAELVASLDVAPELVAVELNSELVAKKVRAETTLSEGDAVEIVTLVGGG